MTRRCAQLEPLLARAAAGELDGLTPEQVAALEAHLDACAACAARLAAAVPMVDPALAAPVAPPSPEQWRGVWDAIEVGVASRRPAPGRGYRRWRPLLAAAAGLLLAVTWRFSRPPPENAWDLQLSGNVVVHEIETFGNVTSLVIYSDEDEGAAAIWLLENGGV